MRRGEPARDCPVCGLPAEGRRSCEECGWPVGERPRPDGSAPEELRLYLKDLERARRAFDAVAAARAGVDRFRCAAFIRGGTPDEVEWAEARRIAASAMISPTPLRWYLSQGLDRRDDLGLAVVEVGAHGVRVTTVRVDETGVPHPRPEVEEVTWPVLLPMLSRDPEERRFQLAGGLAGLDRRRLQAEMEHRAGLVVPMPVDVPVVLVCQTPGWPVPEGVVDALRRLRPDADLVRTPHERAADLLGPVLAEAPLRRAYRLLAAEVVADGKVRLRTLPLFAPGDRAGQETERWVRRPPGGAADMVLAVVAEADDGSPPVLVTVRSVRLGPGRTRVRAVLEAPGRVRFAEPAETVPETRGWPELIALVPDRLTGPTAPVDLLCGIELGGPPELVERRLRLVRELLEAAARECPDPDDLRVAILGYGDHLFVARTERRRPVRRTGLLPVAQALGSLAGFRPPADLDDLDEERRYAGDAAPVEDMLHEAVRLLEKQAADRRRILLTLGGRPPHPVRAAEDSVLPCPHGLDWRDLVRRLRTGLGTACTAVSDRPPRAKAPWRELGADGLWELSAADPGRLAAALGLLPAHAHELPFPLVDKERGAE